MKEKGFTLTELIAVIVIMGIIALIASPIITDIIKNSRAKTYQQQIKEVLRSAERWSMANNNLLPVEDQAVFYLSIPSLKDDGFLKKQDIKNPATGEDLNGCVLITYQEDSLQYDFAYEEVNCGTTHSIANLTNEYPEYACYTFDSGTGTITNYDVTNPICSTDVYIPNQIDGVDVSIIGIDAFRNKGITNVTFPQNLVTIENYAFSENVLKTVKLNGLSKLEVIGEYAFAYNDISSLGLTGLTSLTSIDNLAFKNCKIESLDFTGLTSLTSIGDGAFEYNNSTSINLTGATNLTTIGPRAFYRSRLLSITIPASVTTIGAEAFDQGGSYPWSSVTIGSNATNLVTRFNANWATIGWPDALKPL